MREDSVVSALTKQKILDAARQLGYVPHASGRSLSTRRSRRVGVVAAQLGNPFYPALVEPIHEALRSAGYRTILLTDGDNAPFEVETVLDGSLDGVILSTTKLTSRVPYELSRHGVPYVLVTRATDETPDGDTCTSNNVRGGQLAAATFGQLGHERIGAILGPENTSPGRDRERGFREKLGSLGIALSPAFVRRGTFSYDTGFSALSDLIRQTPRPTAIFCANDAIAIGARNAAYAHQVRVPEELSLIGHDDVPMAGWPIFSLTTIGTHLQRMGRTAGRLLIERIEDPTLASRHELIEPQIVLRNSHGPAPTREALPIRPSRHLDAATVVAQSAGQILEQPLGADNG